MNVYLDIDGVLLANPGQPALHAHEFVEWIVNNFDPYWLTTHCRHLDDNPLWVVAQGLEPETVTLLRQVKPTQWDTWKTEAIDFSVSFYWFDDQVFQEEHKVLKRNNAVDSLITVDLAANEHHLRTLMEQLNT